MNTSSNGINLTNHATFDSFLDEIKENMYSAEVLKQFIKDNIDYFSSKEFESQLIQKGTDTKNTNEQIIIFTLISFIEIINEGKEYNKGISDALKGYNKRVTQLLEDKKETTIQMYDLKQESEQNLIILQTQSGHLTDQIKKESTITNLYEKTAKQKDKLYKKVVQLTEENERYKKHLEKLTIHHEEERPKNIIKSSKSQVLKPESASIKEYNYKQLNLEESDIPTDEDSLEGIDINAGFNLLNDEIHRLQNELDTKEDALNKLKQLNSDKKELNDKKNESSNKIHETQSKRILSLEEEGNRQAAIILQYKSMYGK